MQTDCSIYDQSCFYGRYGRIDDSTKNPCQIERSSHCYYIFWRGEGQQRQIKRPKLTHGINRTETHKLAECRLDWLDDRRAAGQLLHDAPGINT